MSSDILFAKFYLVVDAFALAGIFGFSGVDGDTCGHGNFTSFIFYFVKCYNITNLEFWESFSGKISSFPCVDSGVRVKYYSINSSLENYLKFH